MQKYCSISIIILFLMFSFGMLAGSSYANIDINSVVGVWLFDEGEGDTAQDSFGNGHDGEILGEVKWTSGQFGEALNFPGLPGSFVKVPHEEGLDLVTWSITVWVKIEEVQGGSCFVVIKAEPSNVRNYGIVVEPGFAYPTFTAGPGAWKNVAGKTVVANGEWHHLAATYDKTFERLYVDGTLDVLQGFSDVPDTTHGPLAIGACCANGDIVPVKGIIDDVGVFDSALAEDDIKEIMNNGLESALGISAVSSPGKLSTTWGQIKTSR